MKSSNKRFSRFFGVLFVTLAAVMLMCAPAYAAKDKKAAKPEKAVKATIKFKVDDPQVVSGSFLISGISKSGKTVWTYETSKQVQTELNSASMLVSGKFVHVIDYNKYIRLRLADGKVLLTKKLPTTVYSACMNVDRNGDLYVIGYYGSTLYKLANKGGKILWSHAFPSKYYWPSKITFSGRKVTVFFDGDAKYAKYELNARTGKDLKIPHAEIPHA